MRFGCILVWDVLHTWSFARSAHKAAFRHYASQPEQTGPLANRYPPIGNIIRTTIYRPYPYCVHPDHGHGAQRGIAQGFYTASPHQDCSQSHRADLITFRVNAMLRSSTNHVRTQNQLLFTVENAAGTICRGFFARFLGTKRHCECTFKISRD